MNPETVSTFQKETEHEVDPSPLAAQAEVPTQTETGASNRAANRSAYTPEEEALVEERLKNLGYL